MKVILATSLLARLVGLLDTSRCANGEVLLLAPCKSIHSFGMRSNLDVAFIDAKGSVLISERDLKHAQIRSHPHAVAVLERRSNPAQAWPVRGEILTISSCETMATRKEQNQ